MTTENPFYQFDWYLRQQARLLINPIVAKDDPFTNGNSDYAREVRVEQKYTMVSERWPKMGEVTTRASLLVDGRIFKTTLLYPLDKGYDPRFDFMAVAVNFASFLDEEFSPIGPVGQIQVSKYNRGIMLDTALYREARLDYVQFSTGEKVKIVSGNRMVIDDQLRARVFSERNAIVIQKEDPLGSETESINLPIKFNLTEVAVMVLGADIDRLRQNYVLEFIKKPKPKAIRLPEGRITEQTGQTGLNTNRLNFVKWLILHGRISEGVEARQLS